MTVSYCPYSNVAAAGRGRRVAGHACGRAGGRIVRAWAWVVHPKLLREIDHAPAQALSHRRRSRLLHRLGHSRPNIACYRKALSNRKSEFQVKYLYHYNVTTCVYELSARSG